MTHCAIFNFLLDLAKLLVRKMENKSKFVLGIPLDPNLISNDQVGSGLCPHIKI